MLFFVHQGIAPEIQKIANMKTGLHQPALQTLLHGAIQYALSGLIQNVATTQPVIRKRLKLAIGMLTSQVGGL